MVAVKENVLTYIDKYITMPVSLLQKKRIC